MGEKKLELERTPESWAALVAERCYKDAAFRETFLADPKGAVEKLIGESLPADAEVVACRNDEKRWYIPVPAAGGAAELSEEDLEDVSAGAGIVASDRPDYSTWGSVLAGFKRLEAIEAARKIPVPTKGKDRGWWR